MNNSSSEDNDDGVAMMCETKIVFREWVYGDREVAVKETTMVE